MDLIDRVRRWSARTPEAVAVVSVAGHHTYREIDVAADRLARRLRDRGAGPEVAVGVHLSRRAEAIVALLAVLRAGAVYLPLDPVHPPARLDAMAAVAGARLLVTEAAHAGVLSGAAMEVIDVDAPSAPGPVGAGPLPVPRHEHSLVCVLFTSGSTGAPKGIGLTVHALRSVVDWAARDGLPARCAQFSSPGFDMSLQEILGTLATGGTLVMVTEEQRADPALLLRLLARESVERIYLSPALLARLAAARRAGAELPDRLRHVVVAGAPLRLTPAIREFLAALPGSILENQYGPTETHQATANPLTGPPSGWPGTPTLGRPVPGMRIELLDSSLRAVRPGQEGEVFLSGPAVARGYPGQPALTAERFLPDPFRGRPGARMYRTGDLARRNDDGELVFRGRVDDQVKIRGYRVEPAEIEATLARDPAIREVTVRAAAAPDGTPELVAYVVPHAGSLTAGDVREFARARLPEYMLPRDVVVLDALPVNANGKIDVSGIALPGPAADDATRPRDAAEAAMCELWEKVLRRSPVGIDDNFLEIGGDSLKAMEMAGRISGVFGSPIAVRLILENPTVRELSTALEKILLTENADSGDHSYS